MAAVLQTGNQFNEPGKSICFRCEVTWGEFKIEQGEDEDHLILF